MSDIVTKKKSLEQNPEVKQGSVYDFKSIRTL